MQERIDHPLDERCPRGYRRHTASQQCVSKASVCKQDCDALGKICNPTSRRCVSKTGAVGRRLLKPPEKRRFARRDAKYVRQWVHDRFLVRDLSSGAFRTLSPQAVLALLPRMQKDFFEVARDEPIDARVPKYVQTQVYSLPDVEITADQFDALARSVAVDEFGSTAWKRVEQKIRNDDVIGHQVSGAPLPKQLKRLERATSPNSDEKRTLPCERLVTVPQSPNKGTCWFNALLMVFLFSDGMRALTKRALAANARDRNIDAARLDVLQRLASLLLIYKQPETEAIYQKAFDYGIRPEHILGSLEKLFPLPRAVTRGEEGYAVINGASMMVQLLRISKICVLLDVEKNYYNITTRLPILFPDMVIDYGAAPEVVIVIKKRDLDIAPQFYESLPVFRGLGKRSFRLYEGTYVLDAASFTAENGLTQTHAISGITCDGRRYYYNGWMRAGPKEACPLIPVDWLERDIWLGMNECYLDAAPRFARPFNFHYDALNPFSAVYFYVRV